MTQVYLGDNQFVERIQSLIDKDSELSEIPEIQSRPSARFILSDIMGRPGLQSEEETALCRRYIERQAPRQLMLHGLPTAEREKLEQFSKTNAMEVARFYKLYPDIIDTDLISTLRLQARIRAASRSGKSTTIHDRRDGVLYIFSNR